MPKDQTVVFGSPFKFGFFAGLGFFFASVLMSVISVVVIALLGLGTIGALVSGSHAAQEKQDVKQAQPVRWQVSDSR